MQLALALPLFKKNLCAARLLKKLAMRQNRKHLVRKPGFGSIRRQQHHVCTRCHTDFRRIRGSSAWSEMENEIYQLHFQTCHNQPAPQSSKRSLKMSHLRPEAHERLCVTAPATRKATAAQRRCPRVPQLLLQALVRGSLAGRRPRDPKACRGSPPARQFSQGGNTTQANGVFDPETRISSGG